MVKCFWLRGICICAANYCKFWHFTQIYVKIIRPAATAAPSADHRFETELCFNLWPYYIDVAHSTSIQVTGQPRHGFFSANFQPATQFRSRLRVRYGADRQTDGQTDRLTDNGHQRLMPPSYAGGGIKCGLTHQIKEFFRRVDNLCWTSSQLT